MEYTTSLKAMPYNLNDKQIEWVESTLAKMSIREKTGQLFCLNIVEEDVGPLMETVHKLNIKPGSYMTRGMPALAVRSNFEKLQNNAEIPLLLAGNIERGSDGVCKEGIVFGTQMQIAATNNAETAYQAGLICAKEGLALGVNWNFGPILDIDTNWHNPITNTRVFSSNPDTVLEMSLAYVKGMQEAGMLSCLKHWPGDGQDERDQHMATTTNSLSAKDWMNTYGKIYRQLIEAGAETLMSAHIKLPAFSRLLRPGIKDEDIMPGALAPELNNDLLRGELGFNGLVVSDATSMNGFMQAMPRAKAVPACIAAGVDVFLFTCNLEEDFEFMMQGVENGTISPKRLNEAVTRILALKACLNLPQKQAAGTLVPPIESLSVLGRQQTIDAARKCADEAITLVKDTQSALPLNANKTPRVLLHVLGDVGGYHDETTGHASYFADKLAGEGFVVTLFDGEQADMRYLSASIASLKKKFDMIVYFANIKTSGSNTVARIQWQGPGALNSTRYIHEIPTVFISVDNPYHLIDVPHVKTYINAYTPSPIVTDSLIEKLMGRSKFTGVSPVDASCGIWDAMF